MILHNIQSVVRENAADVFRTIGFALLVTILAVAYDRLF
jgi:hypothetical protein